MNSRWKPCHAAEGPRWRTWVLFRDGRPTATLVCDMRDPRDDTRAVVYPLDDSGTASRFAGAPASGVARQLRGLYGVELPAELQGEDATVAARRMMPSLRWAHGASCREAWADLTPDHPEPGWGTLHVHRRDGHRWPWLVTWRFGGLLGGMGYMSTLEEAVDGANREATAYLARASMADTETMRWRRRAALAVISATCGQRSPLPCRAHSEVQDG